jgi:hypothetical protein
MDLKNYYHDLRSRIKDADAHMFVVQLKRKKEVNFAFLCFEVDAQGRLMCVLNLKERRMPCPHVCGSTWKKEGSQFCIFYDFEVDAQGRLMRVLWEDATSNKITSILVTWYLSIQHIPPTNITWFFLPITGVNHHMQSVFLGVACLGNEKTESYVWLFKTYLKAMGGLAPHLIITDEDASMKATISMILPDTSHRLCTWHTMDKVLEKVGLSLREDQDF